jgi:hypothetical protein
MATCGSTVKWDALCLVCLFQVVCGVSPRHALDDKGSEGGMSSHVANCFACFALNSVGVSATGGMVVWVVSAQHMPDVAVVWQVCTCSC